MLYIIYTQVKSKVILIEGKFAKSYTVRVGRPSLTMPVGGLCGHYSVFSFTTYSI